LEFKYGINSATLRIIPHRVQILGSGLKAVQAIGNASIFSDSRTQFETMSPALGNLERDSVTPEILRMNIEPIVTSMSTLENSFSTLRSTLEANDTKSTMTELKSTTNVAAERVATLESSATQLGTKMTEATMTIVDWLDILDKLVDLLSQIEQGDGRVGTLSTEISSLSDAVKSSTVRINIPLSNHENLQLLHFVALKTIIRKFALVNKTGVHTARLLDSATRSISRRPLLSKTLLARFLIC
jgi:hypothetical protein